jgi:hypothetical protein
MDHKEIECEGVNMAVDIWVSGREFDYLFYYQLL